MCQAPFCSRQQMSHHLAMRWDWKTDDAVWTRFSIDHNEALSTAFLDSHSEYVDLRIMDKHEMRVTFSTMVQTNRKSTRSRDVRCVSQNSAYQPTDTVTWQWQAHGKTNWRNFTPPVGRLLEAGHVAEKLTQTIVLLGVSYEVNFSTNQWKSSGGGSGCAESIRRCASVQTASWEWLDDSNIWIVYPADLTRRFEVAWEEDNSPCKFTISGRQYLLHLHHGDTMMKQENKTSGVVRKVQRLPPKPQLDSKPCSETTRTGSTSSCQPRPMASQDPSPSDQFTDKTMSDSTPRNGQPSSTASLDTSPSDELNAKTNYRFAVMVANDNELHATMHFLGSTKLRSKVKDVIKDCTYKGDEKLKNEIEVGWTMFDSYLPIRVGKIPGVVVKCGTMGSFTQMGSHRTTLQLVKNAIDRGWELDTIFIVGCCGTRPEMKEKQLDNKGKPIKEKPIDLGTVLIANELFQYAMGKLYNCGPLWQPNSSFQFSQVDLKAVQYGDDDYRIVSKVEYARFYSSDFVVKSEDIALELATDCLKTQKLYVGFEMEGVGAMKAITDANIFVPTKTKMPKVVLVKGVSDKTGEDKSELYDILFFANPTNPPSDHQPDKPIPNVEEDCRQQMCTISSLTLVLRYIVQFKASFTNT